MKPPVEFQEYPNLLVFRLSGDLNSFLLDTLKTDLSARAAKLGIFHVLINLNNVEYLTSKDLGVFVQIFHFLENGFREQEIKGEPILAFCGLSEFVQEVMEMTRLETVFRIYQTEEEAIKALSGEQPEPKEQTESGE
jgi:anti-anti-sigma factor